MPHIQTHTTIIRVAGCGAQPDVYGAQGHSLFANVPSAALWHPLVPRRPPGQRHFKAARLITRVASGRLLASPLPPPPAWTLARHADACPARGRLQSYTVSCTTRSRG